MTTVKFLITCLLLLPACAGMLSAQATASTGPQNYPAPPAGQNWLDEYYFDVDFGSGVSSVTLSISITNTASLVMQPELWVIDKLADLPSPTQYAEHNFGFNYGSAQAPAPPGTIGPVPIWGSGALAGFPQGPYSLSGVVRFQFTLLVVGTGSAFPNDITVAFSTNAGTIVPPSGPTVPGSSNMSANIWSQSTPGTSSAFGSAGSSEYLQRHHAGVSFGIARLGSNSDQLQYQIDVEMTGNPISIALVTAAYQQMGNATGIAAFELYDMRAGWDTPVISGSADATLPGVNSYGTYTTGAYTGLARFRVIVRGQSLANVSSTNFADFWFDVIFGYNALVQPVTTNPKLADPRMEMTPTGTTVSGSTQLSVSGGSAPTSYQWSIQGTVPPNVSLSQTTGSSVELVISGPVPANTDVTVRCTNAAVVTPNSEFTQQTYTIDMALQITGPASLPNGVEGIAYGPVTFTGIGGLPPYSWSITGGSLPPGLSLSAAGELTGVPTTAGNYSGIEVTLTDSASSTDSEIYSIEIAPSGSVQITTTSVPNGRDGDPYIANISATGGSAPYAWSVVSGALPSGLSLGTSTTDTVAISGTPTQAGTFNFTVRVVESGNANDEQPFTLVIDPAPVTVTIDTSSNLPGGTRGQQYSVNIKASGGSAPYTWTIVSGSLPDGLSLDGSSSSTLTISGTPAQAGQSTFMIRVQESSGAQDERQFNLNVAEPPAPTPPRSSGSSSSCSVSTRAGYAAIPALAALFALRRRRRKA